MIIWTGRKECVQARLGFTWVRYSLFCLQYCLPSSALLCSDFVIIAVALFSHGKEQRLVFSNLHNIKDIPVLATRTISSMQLQASPFAKGEANILLVY